MVLAQVGEVGIAAKADARGQGRVDTLAAERVRKMRTDNRTQGFIQGGKMTEGPDTLVPIEVRTGSTEANRKKVTLTMGRKQDVRFIEGLEEYQKSAMELIYAGHLLLCSAVRCMAFDPGYVRGKQKQDTTEYQVALSAAYSSWCAECNADKGIHLPAVKMVVIDGLTLTAAAKEYRIKSPTTVRAHVCRALDVFDDLWSKRR